MTRKVLWWLGSPGPPSSFLLLVTISAAATYVDHRGTSFILTFIENRYLVEEPIPRVFLVAATNETATVTISVPLESYIDISLKVYPGTGVEHSFPYDIHMIDDGYNFKAVYIESDKPIVVEAASLNDHSSDAFLVLPTRSLGTFYIVLSYVFTRSSDQRQGPSSVGITAVEDATSVTVEMPQVEELDTSTGQLRGLLEGDVMRFTLYKYQTFHIRSKYEHDLTGVKITANLPVSVVAGSKWTSVSKELMGDHLVENIPPVNSWGTTFYMVPIANRTAGDVIRVLGYTPQTQVRVLSSVEGNKAVKYQLNSMGFVDIEFPSNTTLMILANRRVLVAQLCKSYSADNNRYSDPFMMLVPPQSQYTDNYHFMTVSTRGGWSYNNYLSIVSETDQKDDLILNNMNINKEDLEWGWVQVASSSMSAAILALQNGTYHLRHKDPDVVFGAHLYGQKFQESYGLPLGQKLRPLTYKEICLTLDQEQGDFFDNDCDGLFDEEILNGIDDDGDGLIDEDVFNDRQARPQDGSLVDMDVQIPITHTSVSGQPLFFETTALSSQETTAIVTTTTETNVPTTKFNMESSVAMHTTIKWDSSTWQTSNVPPQETTAGNGMRGTTAAENRVPSTEGLFSTTKETIHTTNGVTTIGSTLYRATSAEDSLTTPIKPVRTSTNRPPTTENTNDVGTMSAITTMAFIPSTSVSIPTTTSLSEQSTSFSRESSSSGERSLLPSTESRLTSKPLVSTAAEGPLQTKALAVESKPTTELPTTILLRIMASTFPQSEKDQKVDTTVETPIPTTKSSSKGNHISTAIIEEEATTGSHAPFKLTTSPAVTDPPPTIVFETDPVMVIIPLSILFGIPLIFICVVIVKSIRAAKRQKNARQVNPMSPPPPPAKAPAPKHAPIALKSKTYQAPIFDARNS